MPTNWQLSGDYFENCNCSVVCPCLISPAPPLTSRPTEGVCDVALAFHIDKGNYGTVALDDLNLALIAHTPGPMAAFAPLIATNLGVKKVPMMYRVTGKTRSAEIPGVMNMSVEPLPSLRENEEIWASAGHPIAPDRLALAVGRPGSTFTDHGMRWDNSGKNGHYAPISWSNL